MWSRTSVAFGLALGAPGEDRRGLGGDSQEVDGLRLQDRNCPGTRTQVSHSCSLLQLSYARGNEKGGLISLIFPRRCLSRSYLNHYIRLLNGLAGHYVFEAHQRRSIKRWDSVRSCEKKNGSTISLPWIRLRMGILSFFFPLKWLISRALNRLWNHSRVSLDSLECSAFVIGMCFPIIEKATTRFRQTQELKQKNLKTYLFVFVLLFFFGPPLQQWLKESCKNLD